MGLGSVAAAAVAVAVLREAELGEVLVSVLVER
jgi:hypothetical protein